MAKTPARRQPTRLPDLLDWLDAPWSPLAPLSSGQTFRVEDYVEDGHYIVRAELPGVDPGKDLEITVDEGTLTIRAERKEEQKDSYRSEFRYGSLTRSVPLPSRADTEHITASYDQGILTVNIPVQEAKPSGRKIEITRS
jgi:HSP20 family molecular chaperone IbpA